VKIELLSAAHDRSGFDCGEPSLNEYLQRYARQNAQKHLGRTYVALPNGENRVAGYYTIASGAVTREDVPENLPHYPVPALHLGRLAVDRTAQGQGLGELLLLHALRAAAQLSERVAIYCVEVYALNAQARSFYLKYGFLSLTDDPLHLYLPMKVILKLGL